MRRVQLHQRVIEAQKRIETANWFSAIGKELPAEQRYANVVRAVSRKSAIRMFCDLSDRAKEFWSESTNFQSEEFHRRMIAAGIKAPVLPRNDFAISIRPWVIQIGTGAVVPLCLPSKFERGGVATLTWSIMYYLLIEQFREYIDDNLLYVDIMEIFLDGHMVCGWKGDFPRGQLVVH